MFTSRRRERNRSLPTTVDFTQTVNGVTTGNSWPVSWDGDTEIIDDVKTPGFFRGNRNINDMSLAKSSRSYSPGSLILTRPNQYYCWSGDLAAYVDAAQASPFDSMVSQMQQLALAKALSRVDAEEVLSGEVLGDLSATIMMLRRPFSGARDLLERIHKAKRRHLIRTGGNVARASAKAWLEYRYGWNPLIMDSISVISRYERGLTSLGKRIHVARAQEQGEYNNVREFADVGLTGITSEFKASGLTSINHEVRCAAGVRYAVETSSTTQALAQIFGTRFRDLPATIWELVPYSFVVDWFANVGNWIKASTPDPSVTYLGRWVTTVNIKKVTLHDGVLKYHDPVAPAHDVFGTYGSSISDYCNVTRDAHIELGAHPVLEGRMLTVRRSADAVSLMLPGILSSLKDLKHR